MSFKAWLLNKIVKYAIKEGRKEKVQEVQKGLPNKESNKNMPGVSIVWKVDKEGNCTCPYHSKKEERKNKRTVTKKTNKRGGRPTLKTSKKPIC